MALTGTGQILGESVIDTASANPTAVYPPQEVGPTLKPVPTVRYYNATTESYEAIQIIDRTVVPYQSVPGVPIQPLVPPSPPQLPRLALVAVQNTTVYIGGTLVVVDGDAVTGPGATPDPRILHGSSKYAKIIIGTSIV